MSCHVETAAIYLMGASGESFHVTTSERRSLARTLYTESRPNRNWLRSTLALASVQR
jgi:dihydrodipicolinate synthase/N-acetylneuraminate lyase